jgi:5'(3')-deoxyribonucleotidase
MNYNGVVVGRFSHKKGGEIMEAVLEILERRFVKAYHEIEKLKIRQNDLGTQEIKNYFGTQIVKQNGIACEIALIYASVISGNECEAYDKLLKKCEEGK